MSELSDTNIITKIAAGGLVMISTIVGFFFRRQLKRIDEIEKHTVKRPEYNSTINSLRQDIKDARKEFLEEHRETRSIIIKLLGEKK